MEIDRLLATVGLALVVLLGVTLVGLVVDSRVITGVPAWLKPAKFAASFALYAFTLIWLLSFVTGHRILVHVAAGVTAVMSAIELVIIAGQAARGTTSHFNAGNDLDGMLFSIMGAAVTILWLMGVVVAILLLKQRIPDAPFAWSLRLGLIITLIAMLIGFLMTAPTPQQQAAIEAGEAVAVIGAHTVGYEDGGPGLPVLGWSNQGGDLRAPHFVGLHALQVLPLFAFLLPRLIPRTGSGHRLALVWVSGVSYLGLVALLTWQALRGQPVIAPDSATLFALVGLILATAIPVAAVLAHGRQSPQAPVGP